MRAGISGTHGTGKTTLAQALCAHLPGHVTADEPYYLLHLMRDRRRVGDSVPTAGFRQGPGVPSH